MPSDRPPFRASRRRALRASALLPSLVFLTLLVTACGAAPSGAPAASPKVAEQETAETLPSPPALPGAMTPNWAVGTEEPLLSWLEPAPEGGMRLRISRLGADGWSEPVTVTSGASLFANWADFPSVAAALPEEGGGPAPLFAHWLAKTGEATYAYGVELARSRDGGAIWEALGSLHPDDPSPTEHGFASFVPLNGGVRAFWLDGREMAGGGPMGLRTAVLRGDTEEVVGAGRLLDDRVCECCQTAAARDRRGAVVVYRDRSDTEVRDIYHARAGSPDVEETEPGRPVAEDGWNLPGCPVNGPAAAATGDRLAVAWFTGAGQEGRSRPRVQAAFSNPGDPGDGPHDEQGFGAPILIDGMRPLGRVGAVAAEDGGVVVSWLALPTRTDDGREGNAEIRLIHVAPDGRLGAPLSVARTQTARASGFPRLTRSGDFLYLAWRSLEDGHDGSRLEVRRLPIGTPAPAAAGQP